MVQIIVYRSRARWKHVEEAEEKSLLQSSSVQA